MHRSCQTTCAKSDHVSLLDCAMVSGWLGCAATIDLHIAVAV